MLNPLAKLPSTCHPNTNSLNGQRTRSSASSGFVTCHSIPSGSSGCHRRGLSGSYRPQLHHERLRRLLSSGAERDRPRLGLLLLPGGRRVRRHHPTRSIFRAQKYVTVAADAHAPATAATTSGLRGRSPDVPQRMTNVLGPTGTRLA